MEDQDRRKRYFRPLYSLGSDEYSLSWSRAPLGAACRNQRRAIRFCLRARRRPPAFNGTFRCARSREEEQISTADAKIPRITDRVERIDHPFGRRTMAGQEKEAVV